MSNDKSFDKIVAKANDRFDVDSYADDLRLGAVYFESTLQDVIGVYWSGSPLSYEYSDYGESVEDIPDSLVPKTNFM